MSRRVIQHGLAAGLLTLLWLVELALIVNLTGWEVVIVVGGGLVAAFVLHLIYD